MSELEHEDVVNDDRADEHVEDGRVTLSRADLQALRKKARAADQILKQQRAKEEEQQEVSEELLFRRANVDIESKLGKLFYNGYSGAMDVDSIRKEAIELGLTYQPSMVPTEELRQHQAMMNASAGSDFSNKDPGIQERIAKAGSPEEVMELLAIHAPNVPTTRNRY